MSIGANTINAVVIIFISQNAKNVELERGLIHPDLIKEIDEAYAASSIVEVNK